MRFGIVADDHTGATDAAGMLTERGVRVVLFLGLPTAARLHEAAERFDAAVIGAQSRSIAPRAAYDLTADAVRLLRGAGAEKVQIKYCSTFDSTPKGNIGPSLDAAMDVLGTDATIVCPALPVNGRTTYHGYHFVNGRLLSESPLKDHPLHPMTDPDLVRWLRQQTKRRVGLAPLEVVRQGPEALARFFDERRRAGVSYFVTDAIEQADLAIIARATAGWTFISGGSGITAEAPGVMFPGRPPLDFRKRLAALGGRTLAAAGSCSPATRGQNARALRGGFIPLRLSGGDVLDGSADLPALVRETSALMKAGKNVLLQASADPAEVRRVQARGTALGLDAVQVGERIAGALAEVCAGVLAAAPVGRLVLAGGETSGAACARLGVDAIEVGLPLDPGVPYGFPLDRPSLLLVLKSGNFGAEDLYLKVRDL